MHLRPLYIVGPTASGKSALAVALATQISGEVVNADAFQLYQGMNICTAQPSQADFAGIKHHLFGVISPSKTIDAERFSSMAKVTIQAILDRGRIPVMVGGSGLYVKSLTHGLMPLPSSQDLREKLSHLTTTEQYAWLLHRDPAAASINPKNDRYVGRALEICLLTGRPQSELRSQWANQQTNFLGICLVPDRAWLDEQINRRVLQMVESGLVDEIRCLPPLSDTASKAIGVREIQAHLAGLITLPEAIAAIQLATRQYARRQEKWFRREKGFRQLAVRPGMGLEEMTAAARRMLPEFFAG